MRAIRNASPVFSNWREFHATPKSFMQLLSSERKLCLCCRLHPAGPSSSIAVTWGTRSHSPLPSPRHYAARLCSKKGVSHFRLRSRGVRTTDCMMWPSALHYCHAVLSSRRNESFHVRRIRRPSDRDRAKPMPSEIIWNGEEQMEPFPAAVAAASPTKERRRRIISDGPHQTAPNVSAAAVWRLEIGDSRGTRTRHHTTRLGLAWQSVFLWRVWEVGAGRRPGVGNVDGPRRLILWSG